MYIKPNFTPSTLVNCYKLLHSLYCILLKFSFLFFVYSTMEFIVTLLHLLPSSWTTQLWLSLFNERCRPQLTRLRSVLTEPAQRWSTAAGGSTARITSSATCRSVGEGRGEGGGSSHFSHLNSSKWLNQFRGLLWRPADHRLSSLLKPQQTGQIAESYNPACPFSLLSPV